jgi:hypothetical protein
MKGLPRSSRSAVAEYAAALQAEGEDWLPPRLALLPRLPGAGRFV